MEDGRLGDIATPEAFHVIHVQYTQTSAEGLAKLLKSKEIAKHVEELSFVETVQRRPGHRKFHALLSTNVL